MGGVEVLFTERLEPMVGYHSDKAGSLTLHRYPVKEQFLVGSLTGAVASQKVTEVCKGFLGLVGNQLKSAKAKESLIVRQTSRTKTKVGLSDPTVLRGRTVAQRTKVTLGITGSSPPRVHIDGEVWHLDVGSSHPGAVVRPKGWTVRP